jgi:riboflavin kinase/FMN adenylyltransferase
MRGVYAAHILIGIKKYAGVANIGYAPTFADKRKAKQLEVHIFNFSRNIAGKRISVLLVKKLRSENKFASVRELKKQIRRDARSARKILKDKQRAQH